MRGDLVTRNDDFASHRPVNFSPLLVFDLDLQPLSLILSLQRATIEQDFSDRPFQHMVAKQFQGLL
jgi:hypothetical protein